jgi:hypothetical protein
MILLNKLPNHKIQALGINDRTLIIMELENIFVLNQLLIIAQNKSNIVDKYITEFHDQFSYYIIMGLQET